MPLAQLQGLTPLGGSPGTGPAPNATGTDPNATDDPNQPKRRATQNTGGASSASGSQPAQPRQITFAQMQQQGIARPAPPTAAPQPQGATAATMPAGQATQAAPSQPRSATGTQATDLGGFIPSNPPQATVGMGAPPPRSAIGTQPTDTNPAGQLPTPGSPNSPPQASVGMQNLPGVQAPTPSGVVPPGSPNVPGAPSALTNALVQSVTGGLANPSAYGAPQVQQSIDALNQNLAVQDQLGKQSIDQTMAQRGLYDSTETGRQYGLLEQQESAQRAQLAAQLATQAAQTYGADRTAAQGAATNVEGALTGQNQSQQAIDLNKALGYGNLTGSIQGSPTLAAQQLASQTNLGQESIDAGLLNSARQQVGGIAQAGLLGQSPTAPDSSWLNFISGGAIGSSAGGLPTTIPGVNPGSLQPGAAPMSGQPALPPGASNGLPPATTQQSPLGAPSMATSLNSALGYGGNAGSAGGLTFPGGSSGPSSSNLVTPETMQARASGQISPIQRYATPDELKTIQYQGPNGQMIQAQPGDQIVLQPTANGQWTPVTRNGQPVGQPGIYTFDYNNPARYGVQPFSYAQG